MLVDRPVRPGAARLRWTVAAAADARSSAAAAFLKSCCAASGLASKPPACRAAQSAAVPGELHTVENKYLDHVFGCDLDAPRSWNRSWPQHKQAYAELRCRDFRNVMKAKPYGTQICVSYVLCGQGEMK